MSLGRRTAKGGRHIRSPSLAPLALAPASPYRPPTREPSAHEERIVTSIRQTALRLPAILAKRVDGASLAVWRILFGLIITWEAGRYLTHDWIQRYWISPSFHFTYFGFGWVQPLPDALMYALLVVIGTTGVMLAMGTWYRATAILLFLAFSYQFLLDQSRYLNHFYAALLFAFIFIVIPANAAFSLGRKRQRTADTVPIWTVWLVRFQVGVIYLFAGIAKLNDDWLSGSPWREWLRLRADLPGVTALLSSGYDRIIFGVGGLAFDLLVVPALLWHRTRLPAFIAVLAFHFINANLFQIGIFPWMMAAATLIFFPPDWPRRFVSRSSAPVVDATAVIPAPRRLNSWALSGLAVYATLQLLMPLRHWLYPGDVSWTEEGHRFAWRMKLRSKFGSATFIVTRDGVTEEVNPLIYLEPDQTVTMVGQPDMLLQFAHFLSRKFPERDGSPSSVRVVALVSLNGRPAQSLVDSLINLAAEPRSLAHARWITQHPSPLP